MAKENNIEAAYPAGFLGTLYFVVSFLGIFPEPYFLLCFLRFIFVIPMNTVARKINQSLNEDVQENSRYSALNWVALILGGLLFVLSVVGIFLPAEYAA